MIAFYSLAVASLAVMSGGVKVSVLLVLAMSFFSLFARADPAALALGSPAPQITAIDQGGEPVVFGDVYVKGITLVYFYPKAETPGCTAEACSLRDAYETLHARGLQILGVSKDTVEAQKKFHENRKLPFTLIADPEGKVAEAFHVPLIPVVGVTQRQSFIIKDGKLAWSSLSAQTSGAAAEVQKALDTLQK
jgi:peroxiredoxin Q/BCP